MFKALKLHFLGFNGMLSSRFPVATYVESVTELHVGDLVELSAPVWVGLGMVLGVAYAATYFTHGIVSSPVTGTALFVVWGFVLLLGEVMLLFASRDQLRGMLETNHHIRTEDTNDRWEEYREFQAMIEAELIVLCLSKASRGEAEKLQGEMVVAHDRYLDEFEDLSQISARWLGRLEKSFQFLLLCQSMLQSLIILMLGRNAFIFFGPVGGAIVLFLLFLPTLLMSLCVTPRVLECLSLAFALGVKTKLHEGVLATQRAKLEHEGDYAQASQVLQLAMTQKLTPADLQQENTVRDKVQDLLKLGEMKWRYRVVEEEQSPRDEAIKVLDEAHGYIDRHVNVMLAQEGKTDAEKERSYKTIHWANELSECAQGLGLARLIFNRDRGEDATIEALLREALSYRTTLKDTAKLAETENSLGTLAQKQADFLSASNHFQLALSLRQKIVPSTEAQYRAKDQSLAQSYTSLGNLYHDWGAAPATPRGHKDGSHDAHMSTALEYLNQAKNHYVKGFNPSHPKVAWAVEAQANVHQKLHNYSLAIACVNEAIALRKGLQEKSDGKALFSKEIEKDNAALKGLEAGRRTALKLKSEVHAGLWAKRRASVKLGQFELKSVGALVDVLQAPNAQCPVSQLPNAQTPNAQCPMSNAQCPSPMLNAQCLTPNA